MSTNQELIDAANARFNSMTPAERRVEVAKDVILQLRNGLYQATKSTYVNFKRSIAFDANRDMCTLADDEIRCECCVRGAMFLSKARKFNNLKMGDIPTLPLHDKRIYTINASNFKTYERELFSPDQIMLMECAFERWVDYTVFPPHVNEYINKLPNDPTERMITIMQNVIDNQGTFVP